MGNKSSLNIPLTDELKKFIVNESGDGTLYSTPSEYVRDLIRHDRDRKEASKLRNAIIEGYQDAIHGRTIEFSGDLKADLAAFQNNTNSRSI
jgi:antitoxin ParD1/3/4